MAIVRCAAGEHEYDDSRYSSCPYCTKLFGGSGTNLGGSRKTVVYPNGNHEKKTKDTSEKTISAFMNKTKDNLSKSPVTGWLVVLEGDHRGIDFKLTVGINTIGRDRSNTITIEFDNTISRVKHCLIEYDYKSRKFYIEKGTNSTYVNDNRVGGEGKELVINDVVEIGETKLKFVPFCNSDFCWEL